VGKCTLNNSHYDSIKEGVFKALIEQKAVKRELKKSSGRKQSLAPSII
jgi:hypothetical protein